MKSIKNLVTTRKPMSAPQKKEATNFLERYLNALTATMSDPQPISELSPKQSKTAGVYGGRRIPNSASRIPPNKILTSVPNIYRGVRIRLKPASSDKDEP